MIKQVLLFACLKVMGKNWSGYKGICFTTNHGFAPFIKNSASNHRIFSRECPASQLNYLHISGLRWFISSCFQFFFWILSNEVTSCCGLFFSYVAVLRYCWILKFDELIKMMTISITIATNPSIQSLIYPMGWNLLQLLRTQVQCKSNISLLKELEARHPSTLTGIELLSVVNNE